MWDPQIDYLVGCHYDSPTNQLFLVAGHNDGPVAFFPVLEQPAPQGNMVAATMTCPVMALVGGHSSIVRSLHCMPGDGSRGPLCFTGGEDALVCMWTLDQELANAAAAAGPQAATGDLAAVGGSAEGSRGPLGQSLQRMSPGPDRQHSNDKPGGKSRRPSPY